MVLIILINIGLFHDEKNKVVRDLTETKHYLQKNT